MFQQEDLINNALWRMNIFHNYLKDSPQWRVLARGTSKAWGSLWSLKDQLQYYVRSGSNN